MKKPFPPCLSSGSTEWWAVQHNSKSKKTSEKHALADSTEKLSKPSLCHVSVRMSNKLLFFLFLTSLSSFLMPPPFLQPRMTSAIPEYKEKS